MIATITTIAALALEKRSEIDLIVWKQHFSDRSELQHFTTIAEEWFPYDRNDC